MKIGPPEHDNVSNLSDRYSLTKLLQLTLCIRGHDSTEKHRKYAWKGFSTSCFCHVWSHLCLCSSTWLQAASVSKGCEFETESISGIVICAWLQGFGRGFFCLFFCPDSSADTSQCTSHFFLSSLFYNFPQNLSRNSYIFVKIYVL